MKKAKRDELRKLDQLGYIHDKKIFENDGLCKSTEATMDYDLTEHSEPIRKYFENISDEQKDALITLMARIMETSYRRGATQAAYLINSKQIKDVDEKYRDHHDYDISPSLQNPTYYGTTAITRLQIQYGNLLRDLGLPIK